MCRFTEIKFCLSMQNTEYTYNKTQTKINETKYINFQAKSGRERERNKVKTFYFKKREMTRDP